jgi:ribosomal protein L37AE/L43A
MSDSTTHTNGSTDIVPGEAHRGEVVDEAPSAAAGQLACRTHAEGTLAVTPQVEAAELVKRLEVIREAMRNAMQEDVDYGRVPGASKPTLLKPGAEKLGVLFQLDIQMASEKRWGPGDHLLVMSRATVYHAPSGARLGYGEGTCSTRERKYAYRRQELTCPHCQANAVIKGKREYGGGWLCWAKRDGCGAKFADGDPSIESQPLGEVENPDLPDLWNTIVKMAGKRARIDAVLAVTGASALFSQDIEDHQPVHNSTPQGAEDPEHQQALANGAQASDDLRQMAFDALMRILGDRTAAKAVGERIATEDGHLCAGAARALVYVAVQQARRDHSPDTTPAHNVDAPAQTHGAETHHGAYDQAA